MNFKLSIIVFILLISIAMGAEYVNVQFKEPSEEVFDTPKKETKIKGPKKETFEERKKRLDAVCEEMLEYGKVYPVAYGPHVWAGKKIAWCAENFVRADGWQLSGWSQVTLDENFNVRRIKIGLISPEIYTDEAIRMHNNRVGWDEFSRWNNNIDTVFGVCFTWRF